MASKYYGAKGGWIDVNTLPNYNAIAQKNSVLLHQISGLIFYNTDVLILTFFCNLTTVSIYTMYKFIVSIITSFLSNISGSCSFKMGQIFTDRGRFIELNDIYERVFISLSFCLYSIVYVFIMPFLRLYTDGMDADYLLKYMPILVVSAEILSQLTVYGHSTDYYDGHGSVELYSYAEFDGFDNDDKYRLMDISARGSNRDGAALRYVAEQLSKRPETVKILILVSDGQPADTGYYGTAADEDLRGIKQEYQRKGILFVAAAIGNDKQNIERIYGDSFLDITDLEQLPMKLTGVVKRHIRV